jgi:hypothetical protein
MADDKKTGKPIRRGTVKAAGCPAGHYTASFVDAREMPPSDKGFDPAMRLVWQVNDGSDADGVEATRICPIQATGRNITGKLLVGLLGRPLEVGEDWDLSPCIGQDYLIVVEENESRTGTRVISCSRVKPKKATTVKKAPPPPVDDEDEDEDQDYSEE